MIAIETVLGASFRCMSVLVLIIVFRMRISTQDREVFTGLTKDNLIYYIMIL